VFYAYGISDNTLPGLTSQFTAMQFLKKQGFRINEYMELVTGVDAVAEKFEHLEKIRPELDYEIDGMVVKVDDFKSQKQKLLSKTLYFQSDEPESSRR